MLRILEQKAIVVQMLPAIKGAECFRSTLIQCSDVHLNHLPEIQRPRANETVKIPTHPLSRERASGERINCRSKESSRSNEGEIIREAMYFFKDHVRT